MQRNICGKWGLRKVHFTNSSRAGCEVGLLRFPMTDVQPTEEDKEAETETEANERGWHSARLEVHFNSPFFWSDPIFSGTSYLPLLFSSQKKAKMIRRKRRRTRKRPRSLRRSRYVQTLAIGGKVVEIHFSFQQHQFTELEVMTLWNSFKIDFPEDRINKIQLNELVAQLFPK